MLLPPTAPTRDSGKTLSIWKSQSSADIPSLLKNKFFLCDEAGLNAAKVPLLNMWLRG